MQNDEPAHPDNMSERARRAIGQHADGDWELKPHKHAEALPPEAGPLRRILVKSEFARTINEQYEHFDSEAKIWQKRHLFWGKLGTISAVLAIVLALFVTTAPVTLPPPANVLLSLLVWLLLTLSWASFVYLMLRRTQERWYEDRGNAEELRKRLFEAVFAAEEPTGVDELHLLPLQLEYFRRYQYEMQCSFYNDRANQFARKATRLDIVRYAATSVTVGALLFTLVATLSAASEQGFGLPWLTWIGGHVQWIEILSIDTYGLGIAIFLSALSAGLFAIAQLDNYRRNVQRYRNARRRLGEIADDPRFGLLRARRDAEAGDRRSAVRLMREMHFVVSNEHADWVTIGLEERDGKVVQPVRGGEMHRYRYVLAGGEGPLQLIAAQKLTFDDFDAIRIAAGAPSLVARRIGFVAARQASVEELVQTRWNGKESQDVAKSGDWIVTNISAARGLMRDSEDSVNTYVIRAERFPVLYEPDGGEIEYGEIYKSKSVVDAFLLPGSFELLAPWNEIQRGVHGYLIRNSAAEVYGNDRETFEATYEIQR